MPEQETAFDIAVVMPVLNEAEYLRQTLDQVYMQEFPMDRVEVVVADGGSTDGTREIAETFRKRFGSLKVLDNPGRKPSSGRNVGIRNSVAPYILVLDGHTYLPSKTLLADLVELFRSTEAACLCRPQPLTPPDISEFERAVALCRGSWLGHKPGSEIYSQFEGVVDPTSSGAMYRRTVVERIGYFDEAFDACEDVDFNYRIFRAGLKAYMSPKLTVYYYPRGSIRGLWRQMLRYGTGRFRFARKHRVFSPVQWLAAAAVVGLAVVLLLALVSSQAASLLRTVVGLYLLLVIFFSGYLVHKHRHLGCLLYGVIIFPTVHFGLGVGFLFGLLEHYLDRPPKQPGIDLDLI